MHKYMHKKLAREMNRSKGELEHCYLCYSWIEYEDWNAHCETHLEDTWTHCGVFSHHNTVLRPAFCPFCIGNEELQASNRIQTWHRDRAMKKHLQDHLSTTTWPRQCPVPRCAVELVHEKSFLYHLEDEHALKVLASTEEYIRGKLKRKRTRDVVSSKSVCAVVATPSDDANQDILSSSIDSKPLASDINSTGPLDCPPMANQVWKSESFTSDQSLMPPLDEPMFDDNYLFSQFIRSPSPDAGIETVAKVNAGHSQVTYSSDVSEEMRPTKRLRVELIVRPPTCDKLGIPNQLNKTDGQIARLKSTPQDRSGVGIW